MQTIRHNQTLAHTQPTARRQTFVQIQKNAVRLAFLFIVFANFCMTAQANSRRENFDNPGGKWMPLQIPDHAEQLKKLGLEIDPTELSDPSSNLLKAIVSLGGCSASFISSEGLLITNHHCVESILAYLSQTDRQNGKNSDFVKTGFLAGSREEERSAGPAREVYITTKFVEVTDEVRAGIERVLDPEQRFKIVEKRIKEIVKRSEAANPNLRSEVTSFFRGEKYYLVEKLRIRDLRIVYAPPQNVGYFGGDEHNWFWPRFVGDFALLRVYVDKEGKPAPYSTENVPYKPEQHLKISRQGVDLRDLVLVAGYPGSTERLLTGKEFEKSVNEDIVEAIAGYNRFKAILDDLADQSEELKIKTSSTRFSLSNVIKNRTEGLEAIGRMNIVARRLEIDQNLQAWIDTSPERKAKYGRAIQDLYELEQRFDVPESIKRTFELQRSPILTRALTIVRKGEQTTHADADRDAAYQQRNWEALNNADKQVQGSLDQRIDAEVLFAFIKRVLELPRAQQHASMDSLFGADRTTVSDEQIRAKLAELLANTELYNLDRRQELLNQTSWQQIQQSSDPLIKLALSMLPTVLEQNSKTRAMQGEYLLVTTKYVQAKREWLKSQGMDLAPDANSTLRVTYGQVREQRKSSDGKLYPAFTTLRELVDHQNTAGKEFFEVPENVLAAAEIGDHEPFMEERFGHVPLNFQANVDTTGGNSGSAALNGRGELVGLLFDGNEETLYTDWYFDADVRSILVDIRYFLWTLHNVEKAKHLLGEMDIQPSCAQILR
jgi:hypothetical protein